MSTTPTGGTITAPMTAIFTPPAYCSSHWTFEPQTANSVLGGLLLQDAVFNSQDRSCRPTGWNNWGRAPSYIQVFSPGYCPVGYSTAQQGYNGKVTTAICCQSDFGFTTTVSSVNAGDKTGVYYGCTSVFAGNGSPTTVLFFSTSGVSSVTSTTLDGITAAITTVSGPILMWGQPITVAYEEKDLSLFVTSSSSGSGTSPASTASSTSSTTTVSSSSSSTSAAVEAVSSNNGLSGGGIAGIVIGAAAIIGILIGVALFLRRRRDHRKVDQARPMEQGPPMYGQYDARQYMSDGSAVHSYVEADTISPNQKKPHWQEQHAHTLAPAEMSPHDDRRFELQ